MSSDMHDLLSRMADELDRYRQLLSDDRREVHPLAAEARAALAVEVVGEGPPAVTTSALLHPAYEPGDGSADGAQMVELAWWHPQFGCDSLQMVVDNARAVLARWPHPAAPPAPEPGEVGEVVAELNRIAEDAREAGQVTDAQSLARAAELEGQP